MNVFYIVIEISGLQQMLKLKDPAVDDLISNIDRSLNNTLSAEMNIIGSFILFTVEAGIEKSGAVVEKVEKILDTVAAYREDIHEFSIVLMYKKNFDFNKALTELKQSYFSYCEDFTLMIEPRVAAEAGRDFDEQNENGYRLIKINSDFDVPDKNTSLDKYISKSDVERIKRIIIPYIDAEYIPEKIILQGDSEFLLLANALRAVDDFSVCINFNSYEKDIIYAFLRSVEHGMIPLIENYLRGVELEIWSANKDRLTKINSDYPVEYLFTTYCLYLKGVMRHYAKELRPQVVVYNGVDPENSQLIEMIERISDYLKKSCSVIHVFLDSQSYSDRINEDDRFFHHAVKKECCKRLTAPESISALSYINKRLLTAVALTEGLLDTKGLYEFLNALGYNDEEISTGISALESSGCIYTSNGRFVRVIRYEELENLCGNVTENLKIYKTLASLIAKNLYTDFIKDYGLAAAILKPAVKEPEVMAALYSCLRRMLDYNRMDFTDQFISSLENEIQNDYITALKIRVGLLRNDRDGCFEIVKHIPEKKFYPETYAETVLIFEMARYYHSAKEYQTALNYVKKVLIFIQSGEYPAFEGEAFLELGFIMLCKGKLLESSEYFNLSVEKLTGTNDRYNLMKALIYSGIQQYIWGALDLAEDYISRAYEIADENGYQQWELYITFFRCRLYFELGRYYDTEKLLSECLLKNEMLKHKIAGNESIRDERRRKLFLAWTARACIYQGKIYRGLNMLLSLDEDPEVLFFLAEAYFFNGDMEKALGSIEKADGDDDYFKLGFMPLEYISWRNGFISFEGRLLRSEKGTGVLLHNIRTMHAYLLGFTGNRDFGIEIMFSLTRDEKISENDPYNRLYFYIYTQLLERRPNTDMIDKLTLMSKALKYLQQTSSRISDPAVRRLFMSKNYWNAKLVGEARTEKLI